MEVRLTPEQEARLSQLAARTGERDAQEVVQQAVSRMLEHEARVVEGINRGIASADRGDLLEHDEVVARVEKLLQP